MPAESNNPGYHVPADELKEIARRMPGFTLIGGPHNGKRVTTGETSLAPYRIPIPSRPQMIPPAYTLPEPIQYHVYRPQAIEVRGEIVVIWAYDGIEANR